MRGPPMLEAQARAAVRAPRTLRVCDAQEHFLPFLEVAAEDLGEVAVGEAGLHGDGSRLTRVTVAEDATRERALTRQLRVRQLRVVLRALGGSENGTDLLARGFANARSLEAALAVAESPRSQVAHLLARVLENGRHPLLLLWRQSQRFRERSRTCSGDCGTPPPVTPGAPPRTGTLSSPGRRKRSAAFGTLSTPSFCATTRRTLAVMPGKSLSSGFRAEMTTL